MQATIELSLKWSFLDFGMRATHIKIRYVADGFRLVFESKTCVLKKGSSFAVNSLSETFGGTVYLRAI